MTAATGRVFGPQPFADHNPIPFALKYPLKASSDVYRNWLLFTDPSVAGGYVSGYVAAQTNRVPVGVADHDQTGVPATDGASEIVVRQQTFEGFVSSTGSNDALLAADIAKPAWAVDNQTVGKKSNLTGTNRSLLGLFLGLAPTNAASTTAIVYHGPIGYTLGRAAHLANAASGGSFVKAVDAGAKTDIAETLIPRPALHGKIESIVYTPADTLAKTTGGAYKKLVVQKRDGAGGAATTVGTLDTSVAGIVAWTSQNLVLSVTAADLDLLETDVLTYSESNDGSTGAVIPAGSFQVNLRVG